MLVRPTPAAMIVSGHRLHQPGGRRRSDRHAAARLHHRPRPGRAGVRAQARHRRRHRRRPAHLSRPAPSSPSPAVTATSASHSNCRASSAVRPARMEQLGGSHGRRQPRRGSRPRARAAHAGRDADQADGRRRRGVAPQPARRVHLHRARAARRRRSGRELGHLRHRARLHARLDPAGDRRRREVHRARPPDGRSDRQADRRDRASG